MPSTCRISSLIPAGFIAENETRIDDEIVLTVRAEASIAPCPICAAPSRRIHSRYIRHVSDLPASGRLVRLRIVTRRFCCEAPRCPRQIFAERFDAACRSGAPLRAKPRTHMLLKLPFDFPARKHRRLPTRVRASRRSVAMRSAHRSLWNIRRAPRRPSGRRENGLAIPPRR